MRPLVLDGVMKSSGVLPASAVVRARMVPDVGGIHRYKHFHRPLVLDSVAVGKVDARSGDKKAAFLHHNELPAIKCNKNVIGSGKTSVRHQKSTSTQSSEQRSSVRSKQNGNLPSKEELKRLRSGDSANLPPINGIEKKVTRRKKHMNGIQQRTRLFNEVNSGPPKLLRTPADRMQDPTPPRRARSVNAVKANPTFAALPNTRLHTSWDYRKTQQSAVKHFGTQTDSFVKTHVTSATPSTLTPEPQTTARSNPESKSSNTPKATQTQTLTVFTKITARSADNIRDLEERSELMQIIDNALDETIDKHSRQRANYFIASSARNLEKVWKDAKLFVSTVLLPQSVSMANRTKSSKTALDGIATLTLP